MAQELGPPGIKLPVQHAPVGIGVVVVVLEVVVVGAPQPVSVTSQSLVAANPGE